MSKEMRVIITGGKEFNNYEVLATKCNEVLRNYNNGILPVRIVSGGARGTDTLGEVYAKEMGYELSVFPADWDKYGKPAGTLRNVQMAKFATEDENIGLLIAFWDTKSRGTSHMLRTARDYGMNIEIKVYHESDIIPEVEEE